MPRLHYLYECQDSEGPRRFVYFCSWCECVLDAGRRLKPPSAVIESLANGCPGCGSRLEASIACRSVRVGETFSEIAHSDYSTGVGRRRLRGDALFRAASSLRGLSFGFPPLDRLVGCLEQGWLAAFTGRYASAAAELLCFRAQLPRAAGGLDSGAVFIDGGNRSDPYLFASYARRHGVDPRRALRRVATRRTFTMYQLGDTVSGGLSRAVDDFGSRLVVVADVLGTFNEPGLRRAEAERVVRAVVDGLLDVRKRGNALVLATLPAPTLYDGMITGRADLLLDLSSDAGRGVRATLARHPRRREARSLFGTNGLLRCADVPAGGEKKKDDEEGLARVG